MALNNGCEFTMAVRCHPLRLVLLCWQQQSAVVITAQSTQAPAECHCQGPAIHYGSPNGYLGRTATINYHYSSLSSPLIFLFCSSFVFSLTVLSPFEFFSFAFPVSDSLSGSSQIVQSNRGFIDHQRKKKSGSQSIQMESHCLSVSPRRFRHAVNML